MRKKSKEKGCLYAIFISCLLVCILAIIILTVLKKDTAVEKSQNSQDTQMIKVEEKDIRYNVLSVDTLDKIAKIIRVDEEVILKAYGLKQTEGNQFNPKNGQQIDILTDVQIIAKDNQLKAVVEGTTKREIIIAKPTNIQLKELVGTGSIVVVTESNHQMAEAILVEKDLETGLLKEKGKAVARALPKDTAKKNNSEEGLEKNQSSTEISKEAKSTNRDISSSSKVKEQLSVTVAGDNWVEFTEKYQEDYTEQVPKYKEVEIVRNQVYYIDREGVEQIYGWYDEIERNEAFDKFINEHARDGKIYYRDIVVGKREIQVGVENVTKVRVGERQAWRNERTGEIVYKKP